MSASIGTARSSIASNGGVTVQQKNLKKLRELDRTIASLQAQYRAKECQVIRMEAVINRASVDIPRISQERDEANRLLLEAEEFINALPAWVRANDTQVRTTLEEIQKLKVQLETERVFWSTLAAIGYGLFAGACYAAGSVTSAFLIPVAAVGVAGGGTNYLGRKIYNYFNS